MSCVTGRSGKVGPFALKFPIVEQVGWVVLGPNLINNEVVRSAQENQIPEMRSLAISHSRVIPIARSRIPYVCNLGINNGLAFNENYDRSRASGVVANAVSK